MVLISGMNFSAGNEYLLYELISVAFENVLLYSVFVFNPCIGYSSFNIVQSTPSLLDHLAGKKL